MSVEAISWALNLAPVPMDRGGQPSSACKFVLVGLANHADPDGTGAFPSVARLVRYTGLSERTVRSSLDRLQAEQIITPCDPALVAARIKRADRRPQGWDLNLRMVRTDLTPGEVAVLEAQFPGLSTRIAAVAPGPVSSDPDSGTATGAAGEPAPPPPPVDKVVDNPVDVVVDDTDSGVQSLHPATGTGCNQHGNGVQRVQPRGAVVAPEPSIEPSRKPSAARAREAPRRDRPAGGGGAQASQTATCGAEAGGVGEFFTALGPTWRLSAAQRSRLAPAVVAALEAGWSPPALAAHTGANTRGVRSAFAVLTTRLDPVELPPVPGQPPARPRWCGSCDERTRRREDPDGGDGGRCPTCHPLGPAPARAAPAGPQRHDLVDPDHTEDPRRIHGHRGARTTTSAAVPTTALAPTAKQIARAATPTREKERPHDERHRVRGDAGHRHAALPGH